ncbi:MAG: hypothetical protein QF497_13875 [Verrucomicrobiota bacterium]|nr:hypothetical protein [Verrucomicrobiota bacterium]
MDREVVFFFTGAFLAGAFLATAFFADAFFTAFFAVIKGFFTIFRFAATDFN